jgi:hypothetical protein
VLNRCTVPSPCVAAACSRLLLLLESFCQCSHAPHSAREGWGLCTDWCWSGRGRSQYGIGLGLIKANGPWGFLALPNALYGIVYYVALALTQLPSTFVASLFPCSCLHQSGCRMW